MFDNLDTALVQGVGFFIVFGYFVIQILFVDKKSKNIQFKSNNNIQSSTKRVTEKPQKIGLFNRKPQKTLVEEKPQKKGLFNRKPQKTLVEDKTQKKGWF